MAEFQFVMRAGPTPGKVYPLDGEVITIGREPSNMIAINDAEVSRRHARLEKRGTAYIIQDLGSTNGTFVNGVRISGAQVLNPGDQVSLGENIHLIYEAVVDPNATMVSSAKAMPATAAPAPRPATPPPPAPRPAVPPPSAAPVYSGQVPAAPFTPAPAKKSNVKIVIIVLVVLAVCIILACLAFLLWVDADQTGARWCQYLPFVVSLVGGVCP
ncbi:MAG: FHA domain-containing protein [Anaerolineales bacterium]|nr:FHA domain-containing protein [Anaerolineales bacterium]MCX7608492.1 FHA domain-containing protein [Anaerolineales bacterium]MDW8227168.1 FHA domain-containing protein [Anaerolineales bacterium]